MREETPALEKLPTDSEGGDDFDAMAAIGRRPLAGNDYVMEFCGDFPLVLPSRLWEHAIGVNGDAHGLLERHSRDRRRALVPLGCKRCARVGGLGAVDLLSRRHLG
jgi:hypothetical protein